MVKTVHREQELAQVAAALDFTAEPGRLEVMAAAAAARLVFLWRTLEALGGKVLFCSNLMEQLQ
jgi:hypothetical protein